ncbi:MAG: TonB-dependent receptor, partial [Alphaproteobacteria bacterium]
LNSRFNNGIGNLNIYSNYSYLQATFESAHTLPAANHPMSNNDIEAGDYLPGMPEHTFKTGINQEFSSQLNAGLNMTYSSGVFLRGDESNQLKKTNPYLVFNADASWKLSKSFSFFARVDNLLDSKYETMGVLGEAEADEVNVPISELGDTGSGETAVGPLDPRFYSPGAPRSFFIGLRVNW